MVARCPGICRSLSTGKTCLGRYDPGNRFAVNYMWGTTGIGYNVARVRERLGPAGRRSAPQAALSRGARARSADPSGWPPEPLSP